MPILSGSFLRPQPLHQLHGFLGQTHALHKPDYQRKCPQESLGGTRGAITRCLWCELSAAGGCRGSSGGCCTAGASRCCGRQCGAVYWVPTRITWGQRKVLGAGVPPALSPCLPPSILGCRGLLRQHWRRTGSFLPSSLPILSLTEGCIQLCTKLDFIVSLAL